MQKGEWAHVGVNLLVQAQPCTVHNAHALLACFIEPPDLDDRIKRIKSKRARTNEEGKHICEICSKSLICPDFINFCASTKK